MGPFRLLKTVTIRLWDAVRTFFAVLFGTLERRNMKPTLRLRQNAELENALLEVNSVLERLHGWTTRQGARESRAAKKALDSDFGAGGPEVTPHPGPSTSSRKSMLRAYYHGRGAPPPVAPVPNNNGDEQLEMHEELADDEENP